VIPRAEQVETLIEFGHRLSSGLTLPLVIGLVYWAWRLYPKGSLVRVSSVLAVVFTIVEALVGAGLVLFGLVAQNDSVARAVAMMIHLGNTLLLVAALALTAWWASGREPSRLHLGSLNAVLLLIGWLAMLVLGASGAVTALGDTLFPASGPLAEEIGKDFSPTAHYLVRLRVLHPMIAVSVGIYLAAVTAWTRRKFAADNGSGRTLGVLSSVLFSLYGGQIMLGIINVALYAPVWLQLIHLLVTNLIWISFVLLTGVALGKFAPGVSNQPAHVVIGEHPG
jgi:heme A synthase